MTVHSILQDLMHRELPRSLEIFLPELLLCATILILVLGRLFGVDRRIKASNLALAGTMIALVACFAQFIYLKLGAPEETVGYLKSLCSFFHVTTDGVGTSGSYFTGLMMHDEFAVFFRLGLLLFLVLVIALTSLTGIPDDEDGPDFYTLLCGATLGMLLATGANHLLMMFVAIEMMSVPSYVMVGFLKGRKPSSEAAFKYVVYGAGAAGVMLYGISLLSGLLGSGEFPELAVRLSTVMQGQAFGWSNPTSVLVVLSILMILVGLLFKLSVVPFHFWCPDAFEGAAAEVGGFLSVASKAAAFALLVRFMLSFQGAEPALANLTMFFGITLGALACLSMTYGNLTAYTQTNLKRLLAYSTIAHAGYMLLGVSATLMLINAGSVSSLDPFVESVYSIEGLTYYIVVYLFMNLSAFAIVALLRNETLSENIDAYRGLIASNSLSTKVLCICLGITFFSLVGMPPFGGFFAKFAVFASAFQAGKVHWIMWAFLAIAGLNTVFSLFYYLKVLKAVFITDTPVGTKPVVIPAEAGMFVFLLTLPILILGASPLQDKLAQTAEFIAASLFR